MQRTLKTFTHQLTDLRMIFILLRSLNAPGEEEGRWKVRWAKDREVTCPPLSPLLFFPDVQCQMVDLRWDTVAPAVIALGVLCTPAFHR